MDYLSYRCETFRTAHTFGWRNNLELVWNRIRSKGGDYKQYVGCEGGGVSWLQLRCAWPMPCTPVCNELIGVRFSFVLLLLLLLFFVVFFLFFFGNQCGGT